MSQAGFTPIQLYRTTTAAAVPLAADLAAGELAINTTDEKLYFKNAAGTVKLLASNSGSAGDVVGPASATDGNLAAFDGATGKLIKQAATVTVTQGGTGIGTTTAYSVVFSGTTATGPFQAAAGPGTATYVLTSNGAGALPTFQAPTANASAGGVIWENSLIISANYTLTAAKNGFSVGPITINSGYAVTVPSGQRWVVL